MSNTNLAYSFTIGPGELSKQGIWLLRSIKKNTEANQNEIFVYIVKEEKEEINQEILDEVRDKATVIEGEMPNEEYPLSAAHAALKQSAEKTDKEYVILLDTDTLVLDDVDVQEKYDAELFMAPNVSSHIYWADEENEEVLKQVFDEYGFKYPDLEVKSNFEKDPMNPIYNSGVIIAKSETDFPDRYLELSQEIFGELPEMNYYADMVAPSMISTEYSFQKLEPQYNFTQTYRPYPQEGTKIVHYFNRHSLYRGILLSEKFGSGWFSSKCEDIGIKKEYRDERKLYLRVQQLMELDLWYSKYRQGEPYNFKIRRALIKTLELTRTKQLARDVVNFILGEQKFKDEDKSNSWD